MLQGAIGIFIFLALTAEAQPPGNVCDLPKVVGTCNARIKRFHFDVHAGTCEEFYYRGCDGNNNNFKTKEECQTVCNKRVCNLPQFGGPGVEAIQRWFYNDRMMQCESFMYGGLNGNMNNFRTKTECEGLCNGVKSFPCGRLPECGTPQRNRYMHCYEHTRSIKNGVFCSTGCGTERRCKKGFCPKDPQVTCAYKCISDRDCNGKRLCCSKCCRDPEDRKPGKCSNDSSQLTVHRSYYLRKSECERDSQCVGNRKCCRFSCGNICVDPDYAEFRDNQLHILMLPRNNI